MSNYIEVSQFLNKLRAEKKAELAERNARVAALSEEIKDARKASLGLEEQISTLEEALKVLGKNFNTYTGEPK